LVAFELSRKVEVNISKELVNKNQRRVDKRGGEFQTVEEFTDYVLTEDLRDEQEQLYTPEEEEEIRERLRRLGAIKNTHAYDSLQWHVRILRRLLDEVFMGSF